MAQDRHPQLWPILPEPHSSEASATHEVCPQFTRYWGTKSGTEPGISVCSSLYMPLLPDLLGDPAHFVHCRKNGTREEAVQKLRKNMKKMSSNQFGMILADVLDQWMTEPSILPSFEKCRDPKLHYDQFPLEYQLLIHQAIKDQGELDG